MLFVIVIAVGCPGPCIWDRERSGPATSGCPMSLALGDVERLDHPPSPRVPLRRAFDGSTARLALAGAWLSNPPLGVMAGYLLAAVALLWALLNKSWAPLLRAAVAACWAWASPPSTGSRGLERSWVDIRQATEDPGYNFENNWLFAHNANPLLALHDVDSAASFLDRRLHDRRRPRRPR